MLVLKQHNEGKSQDQRIASEKQLHGLPVGNPFNGKVLHHFADHHPARYAAKTVGHHQERPLSAGADFRTNLFFHEHRTRDIEEVEGAAIHDHRQHQQQGEYRAAENCKRVAQQYGL